MAEFAEVVEGSAAKLDFYWSLSSCTALVGAGLSTSELLQNHLGDCLSRKFSVVVWAELQSAPKILQQPRHDWHKARRPVPLRWTVKAVEAWLDLLEESAPVSDPFRRCCVIS